MSLVINPVTLNDLTVAQISGSGVFDVLMRAAKEHLEQEFNKNRIRGPEYSQVYLGSLVQILQTSVAFLMAKDKAALEAQLLQKQIALAQAQIEKTASEKLQVEAQTLLINQQRTNLVAEAENIPKQGQLIDAQKEVQAQQKLNLVAEALNIPKQGLVLDAQKLQIAQQTTNLLAESLNIPKQGLLIDAQAAVQTQQRLNLISEELGIDARTDLTVQQKVNAITENTVLIAQECKLRAEFDLIMSNVLKSGQETSLLTQKVATEKAQITALGVDADSVVGRQKALYVAQTDGFKRDAEQKAAKLMVDTWNVRRTTDEGTVADSTNSLNDAAVGRAVNKLLAGVNA
jgi:hypothetical protein